MSIWFQIIVPSLIGFFGLYFSLLTYRRNKAELFHKLFTEFNARYNKLNNKLYDILEFEKIHEVSQERTLDQEISKHKNVVIDYFNLCAEEYLWVKKGYIDQNIWKAWQSGIMWWYNNSQIIRKIWDEEKEFSESYYMKDGESFLPQ